MFIAAILIIHKIRKQPKRPSTDERLKKMWGTHTMEYDLAFKKGRQFRCGDTDGPGKHYVKGNEVDIEIPAGITSEWNLKPPNSEKQSRVVAAGLSGGEVGHRVRSSGDAR